MFRNKRRVIDFFKHLRLIQCIVNITDVLLQNTAIKQRHFTTTLTAGIATCISFCLKSGWIIVENIF